MIPRPLIALALTAALVTPALAQTAVDPGNVTANDVVTKPLRAETQSEPEREGCSEGDG